MNGEVQVLEKEAVEIPSLIGGMQIVKADNLTESEPKIVNPIEFPNAVLNNAPRNERFSRLKKHLRKRSVSIL